MRRNTSRLPRFPQDSMREEPRGVHRFFTSLWLLLVELVFTVAAGAVCIAALFVRKGVCDSDVTMEGKTVIVTGSNAGGQY